MRIVKELPVPTVTLTQQIAFGILCAAHVYYDPVWDIWAWGWLLNIDRSAEAAHYDAMYAAGAAAGPLRAAMAAMSAALYSRGDFAAMAATEAAAAIDKAKAKAIAAAAMNINNVSIKGDV
jgi:hypothetical protein